MSKVPDTPQTEDSIMPFIEDPLISAQQESEERAERIRVKNRRRLYLDRNPSYFTSPDLELAGALIRHSINSII